MEQVTTPAARPATSISIPEYWTPPRQEIHRWLQDTAPSVADLYEGAVHLVFGPPFPGRLRFTGHAVREIRNVLPSMVSQEVQKRGRLDYASRMDVLAQAWEGCGLALEGTLSPGSLLDGSSPPSPDIPIPRALYRDIAGLLGEHNRARMKTRDAATHLFQSCIPESRSTPENLRRAVDDWIAITDWFMQQTHDSGQLVPEYNSQVQAQFVLFESMLGTLSRDFFTTLGELDAILNEANS